MKKVFALMSIVGLLTFANFNDVKAQDQPAAEATEQVTDSAAPAAVEEAAAPVEEAAVAPADDTKSFHQVLKEKYIQGGAGWMTPVLLCLIFGMALVIERILYLNMATTNVKKLLDGIEDNVKGGNYEGAKELCRNTRGPVASIFYKVSTASTRVWRMWRKPSPATVVCRWPAWRTTSPGSACSSPWLLRSDSSALW